MGDEYLKGEEMFKVGDRVLIDWEGLRGIVSSLEFKHFKNLLTKEIKRGDGSLEIFEIGGSTPGGYTAGVAGWSGSAVLGLIYVPVSVLIKANPAKYGDANGDAATELLLYIENDGDLYRQKFIPIVKNLQKKLDKGTFDSDKAIKLWMFLIDAGAKKYTKEYGSPGDKWNDLFNKATRLIVAHGFNESFLAEIKAGNRWDI